MDVLTGLSPPIPVLEEHPVGQFLHNPPNLVDQAFEEEGWIHLDIVDLRDAYRALLLDMKTERLVRLQMEEMLVTVGKTLKEVRREKFEALQRAEKAELFIASSMSSKWRGRQFPPTN